MLEFQVWLRVYSASGTQQALALLDYVPPFIVGNHFVDKPVKPVRALFTLRTKETTS